MIAHRDRCGDVVEVGRVPVVLSGPDVYLSREVNVASDGEATPAVEDRAVPDAASLTDRQLPSGTDLEAVIQSRGLMYTSSPRADHGDACGVEWKKGCGRERDHLDVPEPRPEETAETHRDHGAVDEVGRPGMA